MGMDGASPHVVGYSRDSATRRKVMAGFDKRDLGLLSRTPLFFEMEPLEIEEALDALTCVIRDYRRGQTMMRSGDPTSMSGLIMRGEADIFTAPNLDGGQQIIARISMGEMYGEPFNCLSYNAEPITVKAVSNVRVLALDVRSIFDLQCDPKIARCMLANLSVQFAEKIIVFRNKVEVLSQPTLKMKALTVIKQYAEYQNTLSPVIPFNKVQWARYLAADRNSVSRALSKLEDEGWVRREGNRYHLLKSDNMMFIQRSFRSPRNAIHACPGSKEGLAGS